MPFALLGVFEMVLITSVALFWFRVPFEGSFLLLLPAGLLFLLCTLGVGLLISTVSNTQQEAMLTSFLVIMPVMLLSGFMFPVSSMPVPFQWLTLLNPLRHFLEIVRAIFLKGAGPGRPVAAVPGAAADEHRAAEPRHDPLPQDRPLGPRPGGRPPAIPLTISGQPRRLAAPPPRGRAAAP